jgi:MFS family permease
VIHAFRALRVRDFRLLWAGGLVSSAGTWLLTVAVPAQVLQATGSLRDTGLVLAAEYLPQLLLGPVAGVTADRWDRRLVMAASSAASAAAVAVMLLGTAPGRYWVLYIALAAETSAAVFYAPAIQARTPEVVGTGPLLSSASSLTAMTSGVVRLTGGPLGGVLFAFAGIRWLICADAASYLIAAAAVLMTSRHPSRPETGQDGVRARPPVPAARTGVRASLAAASVPCAAARPPAACSPCRCSSSRPTPRSARY